MGGAAHEGHRIRRRCAAGGGGGSAPSASASASSYMAMRLEELAARRGFGAYPLAEATSIQLGVDTPCRRCDLSPASMPKIFSPQSMETMGS
ncbi:unnamed protein product [Urochloa humidicola]